MLAFALLCGGWWCGAYHAVALVERRKLPRLQLLRLVAQSLRRPRRGVLSFRRACLTPGAFGAALATKHFTNGKTDHELVVGLYADFVREALGGATALDFGAL